MLSFFLPGILFCCSIFFFHTLHVDGCVKAKINPLEFITEILQCQHQRNLELDVSDLKLEFYDFPNKIKKVFPLDTAANHIKDLHNVDLSYCWVIYVPGFNTPMCSSTVEVMREAMKCLKNTYFLIVDHHLYTYNNKATYKARYEHAVKHVYDISKVLAMFLEKMKDSGVSPDSIRCIGHSLGSQILGYTGVLYKESTGSLLKRITALDPAGPCFYKTPHDVSAGAAEYVEIFNCNAGYFGTASKLGDVNFVMNKDGAWQPQCEVQKCISSSKKRRLKQLFDSARCSHGMCVAYYAWTVKNENGYVARKCDSYKSYKAKECAGDTVVAGFWSPGTAKGVYYVSTEDQ